MKFLINDCDKAEAGVYVIKVEEGSSVYVGSTCSLLIRYDRHFYLLKKGIHHCVALQRAFNKYGPENFSFELLEVCNPDVLMEREQFWMDSFQNLYNSLKFARSSKGRTFSEISKKKLSDSVSKSTNTSGYKGVTFHKATKKWVAVISVQGVRKHLGCFDTSEEAFEAYTSFLAKPYSTEKKPRKDNTSGFLGVYFHTQSGKWRAQCTLNGRAKIIGHYKTAEEANVGRLTFLNSNQG